MKLISIAVLICVVMSCGKSKSNFKDTNKTETLDRGDQGEGPPLTIPDKEVPQGEVPSDSGNPNPPGRPDDPNSPNDPGTPKTPGGPKGPSNPPPRKGGDDDGETDKGGDKETPEPDGPSKFSLMTINQSQYQDNCNNGLKQDGVNDNNRNQNVAITSDLYYLVNGNGNDVVVTIPENARIGKLCIWVNGGNNQVVVNSKANTNELYLGINGERSDIHLKVFGSSMETRAYRHISGSKSDVTAETIASEYD